MCLTNFDNIKNSFKHGTHSITIIYIIAGRAGQGMCMRINPQLILTEYQIE